MTVSIMQPYIFPYVGYFQLLFNADDFIFLDDVNYIKKGWINRNSVLNGNEAGLFTVPVSKASQNRKINEHYVQEDPAWKVKLLRSLEMNYKKRAPHFERTMSIVDDVLVPGGNLADVAIKSIEATMYCAGIDFKYQLSSAMGHAELRGEQRIVELALAADGTTYVNPPGGAHLYNDEAFQAKGLALKFLKPETLSYDQAQSNFVPNLSVIDLLMFLDGDQLKDCMQRYRLLSKSETT